MTLAGLDVGTIFAGDYRVVRRLSEGGMGAVYVVDQLSTGKQRALKVMLPQLVADLGLRKRFEQEARIGARIRSDHVVEVQAAGVDADSGVPYLVMELLNGCDLAEHVARKGPMTTQQMLMVFEQLLHAVSAAHAAQIVHRDLKPENIFLAESNLAGATVIVKVLDFGIAKMVAEVEALSPSTAAIGSPLWMAPEQTERGPVTPTADVWALGLIAYYALTGKVFWRAANTDTKSVAHLMREMLFEPIPVASVRAAEQGTSPSLPPWFDAWFARCTTRDANARFVDGAAALAALRNVAAHGATMLAATRPAPMPARKGASAMLAMGGVLLGILLLGGVAAAIYASRSNDPSPVTPSTTTVLSPLAAPITSDQHAPAPSATPSAPHSARPHASSSTAPTTSAAPSSSASSASMPDWLVGDWKGTGVESDGSKFTMNAVFFADGSSNVVYVDDHCAANWTVESASPTHATLAEHVYRGTCPANATITLDKQGASIAYQWRDKTGHGATGELTRK